MNYAYLFLFSCVAVLMWTAAGLWWRVYKTGEKASSSIAPSIPVIPILCVLLAAFINLIGLEKGLLIGFILNGVLFLVSLAVFIYAVFKVKLASQ